MPQLAPINWTFLFIMFWSIMLINTSIMWWNNNNTYTFTKNKESMLKINYNW
uniref:ATP synthase F0 subunit 8 n=1 Tax=Sepiadariidae sp. GS-2020 TaxID=2799221 RepID=A0A8F5H7R1_9MOLL|nr:ATP synthase F0 subunit 8 [Sepiadariidae sp. GS-2020]